MNKHPNTDNHSATSKRPDMESASIVMAAVTSSIDDAELHTQPNQDYTQPAIEAQSAIDSISKLLKEPVTYRTHTDTRLYTAGTVAQPAKNSTKTQPHCIQNYPVNSLESDLLALKTMLSTPKEDRAGKFERSDDKLCCECPKNSPKTSPRFKLASRPRNIPLCLSNPEILNDTSCDPENEASFKTFISIACLSGVVLLFVAICNIYSKL